LLYITVFWTGKEIMQPGIYDNISNEEYHSGPGVSNSGLGLIGNKSPLHFRARQLAANDNEPTAAQAIGTAFHMLILEPELFVKTYTLGLRQSDFPDAIDSRDQLVAMVEELNKGRLPKLSSSGTKDQLLDIIAGALTNPDDRKLFVDSKLSELKEFIADLNKGREGLLSTSGTIPQLAALLRSQGCAFQLWDEIKAEWLANNGHRIVLEPEEWDQLHNMRAAVMAHPAARSILSMKGKAEQSVYWVDEETGVLCRIRPDWWVRQKGIVLDVKTTEDASAEAFRNSIARYGYDSQDAMYTDGIKAATGKTLRLFAFLAVEKSARVVDGQPLGVAVYLLDDASRDLGRAKYRANLKTYAECERSGNWPGYGNVVQHISLPNWNFAQNAHLVERVA
jgi:exodeoxyribonuclease VIII